MSLAASEACIAHDEVGRRPFPRSSLSNRPHICRPARYLSPANIMRSSCARWAGRRGALRLVIPLLLGPKMTAKSTMIRGGTTD